MVDPSIRSGRHARAFTLVELLVVIGIIGVLVALLLPSLTGARRQAERARCLAALQQTGQAFMMYAANNQGAWPLQRLLYRKAGSLGTLRERRFFDFISPYLLNGRETSPDGVGAPAVSDPDIRDGNNVIWGCPSWKRMTKTTSWAAASIHTGYNMNIFPFAPEDLETSGSYAVSKLKVAQFNLDAWNNKFNGGPDTALALYGKFWQQTAWKKPSDRALMFDAVHPLTVVSFSSATDYVTKWPYKPENPSGADFPTEPDGLNFALDYNRHGKNNVPNAPDAKSMNMLFCDGHAEFVSAREAYRAIRFK